MKKILILSRRKVFPMENAEASECGRLALSLARLGHDVVIYSMTGKPTDYGQGLTILYQGIDQNLVEEVNLGWATRFAQALAQSFGLPGFFRQLDLSLGLMPSSLRNRLHWADVVLLDQAGKAHAAKGFGRVQDRSVNSYLKLVSGTHSH